MVHIVGWMLVVNQTLTPAENFTVILALCRGNDIVSGVWLTEIKRVTLCAKSPTRNAAPTPCISIIDPVKHTNVAVLI